MALKIALWTVIQIRLYLVSEIAVTTKFRYAKSVSNPRDKDSFIIYQMIFKMKLNGEWNYSEILFNKKDLLRQIRQI